MEENRKNSKIIYIYLCIKPSKTRIRSSVNYDEQDDVIEDRIRNATKDYGKVHLFLFHKPKELLSNFIDYLYKSPPDIITAWNSKFDIPYIVRKTSDYFDVEGLKRLSPFNRVSYKVESALETNSIPNTDALIPGIDIIDLMELYKKYSDTEKSSYSLDNVAEEEIKENKIKDEDSDSTDLYSLYNDNFVKFIKYNINDVRLMVGINGKKKLLELAITIRNVTKVNFQDIFHETVTVDNLFVMEANKRRENGNWNYVLPTKRSVIKKKFTGAYVKPPIVGLFKWMADLKH
jgi:DNA polymerase elongation subunit (family B)